PGDMAWHDITLTTPVTIDATQDLWLTFYTPDIAYPMSGCDYVGNNNSDFLSLDGTTWEHSTDYGLNYTWMIRGLVEGGAPVPPPTDGNVLGAMVFVDGEWEAFVPVPTNTYTYEGEGNEICVRMVYNGTDELPSNNFFYAMSCEECEEINPVGPGTCEPGAPIHAEQLSDQQIKVWWGEQPAAPISEWLYYDDGTYGTSIGVGGGVIYWGTMFPAASIAPYAGTNLTKVALYENSYNTNVVTVNIYLGGTTAPGTMVSTMNYSPVGGDAFHEVALTTPVAIDGTQNLWIVFSENGTYPANACADTGDPNNRWVSLDGADWMDVAEAGVPGYGWMIRGFVTNEGKGGMVENIALEQPAVMETSAGKTLSHTEVVSKPADLSFMNRASLVKYNVYRSTEPTTGYTLIGEVAETGATYYEYIDTPVEAGTYYYQVRAYYDNDCESEPAVAADDPTHNYVSGSTVGDGLAENDANVALYPNPTNGNVTIEAAGMSRITVVSVLGQVVYDTEVNADNCTLNMAQFNAGMYMVRVYTESGVTVKRVTVMQ
ncbi:MAG: T9SS type A sorting domain-containing protein, partial [Bacteroidales bacterium]|nr:T9SS type A sorting domain-containing protein [Bacteroidales bacterium]